MEEKKDKEKELRESAEFYKEEKIKVHVVLQSKRFYNGRITGIKESILIVDDAMLGATAIPISEIMFIERFNENPNGKVAKSFYQM